MLIETTRFGPIEVDDSKIMTFRDGVLGFPKHRRFALIQTASDPVFFWMQSADDPNLAFVVCDPRTFVPDYQVTVRNDDVKALELRDLQDCQVLVIVNKVSGDLTANLLGPIVVGTTRCAPSEWCCRTSVMGRATAWCGRTPARWLPKRPSPVRADSGVGQER